MDLILAIALMVVFALVGAGGGYFYRKNMAEKRSLAVLNEHLEAVLTQ